MNHATATKKTGAAWPLLLSYLSSLLLVVLAAVIVLMLTFTNPAYLRRQVKASSFANTVYALLSDNYISYGASTGFSQEVMLSFLSADQIASDMNQSVDKLYQGDTAFNDHTEVKDACYAALKADVESRGYEVTEDVQTGIEVVADACRSDYASYVGIPLASQAFTLVTKLNRILWAALILSAIFAAASLVLTVKLTKSSRLGVRCLVYSFTSAAALCAAVALAVYPSLKLTSINIQPASLRLLLLAYIRNFFGSFGLFAVLYGILAVALLCLTVLAHRRSVQRSNLTKTN